MKLAICHALVLAPLALSMGDPLVEWAQLVESQAFDWDVSLLESSYDMDDMFERAREGRVTTDSYADELREGLESRGDPFDELKYMLEELDGTFMFLEKTASDRVLFRSEGDDGLDYVEFVLEKDGDAIIIVDSLNWSIGESTSAVLGRLLGPPKLEGEANTREARREELKRWRVRNEILLRFMGDDLEEAFKAFEALPDDVAQEPFVMLSRTMAAATLEEDEPYFEAMEALMEVHPDEVFTLLARYDYHAYREQPKEMLEVLDALEEEVDDPFLDLLRADAHEVAGDYEKMLLAIEAAIGEDERLDYQTYWRFLALGVGTEDWDFVVEVLIYFELAYGLEWGDLTQEGMNEYYAEFRKTEAYQRWLDRDEEGNLPDEEGAPQRSANSRCSSSVTPRLPGVSKVRPR